MDQNIYKQLEQFIQQMRVSIFNISQIFIINEQVPLANIEKDYRQLVSKSDPIITLNGEKLQSWIMIDTCVLTGKKGPLQFVASMYLTGVNINSYTNIIKAQRFLPIVGMTSKEYAMFPLLIEQMKPVYNLYQVDDILLLLNPSCLDIKQKRPDIRQQLQMKTVLNQNQLQDINPPQLDTPLSCQTIYHDYTQDLQFVEFTDPRLIKTNEQIALIEGQITIVDTKDWQLSFRTQISKLEQTHAHRPLINKWKLTGHVKSSFLIQDFQQIAFVGPRKYLLSIIHAIDNYDWSDFYKKEDNDLVLSYIPQFEQGIQFDYTKISPIKNQHGYLDGIMDIITYGVYLDVEHSNNDRITQVVLSRMYDSVYYTWSPGMDFGIYLKIQQELYNAHYIVGKNINTDLLLVGYWGLLHKNQIVVDIDQPVIGLQKLHLPFLKESQDKLRSLYPFSKEHDAIIDNAVYTELIRQAVKPIMGYDSPDYYDPNYEYTDQEYNDICDRAWGDLISLYPKLAQVKSKNIKQRSQQAITRAVVQLPVVNDKQKQQYIRFYLHGDQESFDFRYSQQFGDRLATQAKVRVGFPVDLDESIDKKVQEDTQIKSQTYQQIQEERQQLLDQVAKQKFQDYVNGISNQPKWYLNKQQGMLKKPQKIQQNLYQNQVPQIDKIDQQLNKIPDREEKKLQQDLLQAFIKTQPLQQIEAKLENMSKRDKKKMQKYLKQDPIEILQQAANQVSIDPVEKVQLFKQAQRSKQQQQQKLFETTEQLDKKAEAQKLKQDNQARLEQKRKEKIARQQQESKDFMRIQKNEQKKLNKSSQQRELGDIVHTQQDQKSVISELLPILGYPKQMNNKQKKGSKSTEKKLRSQQFYQKTQTDLTKEYQISSGSQDQDDLYDEYFPKADYESDQDNNKIKIYQEAEWEPMDEYHNMPYYLYKFLQDVEQRHLPQFIDLDKVYYIGLPASSQYCYLFCYYMAVLREVVDYNAVYLFLYESSLKNKSELCIRALEYIIKVLKAKDRFLNPQMLIDISYDTYKPQDDYLRIHQKVIAAHMGVTVIDMNDKQKLFKAPNSQFLVVPLGQKSQHALISMPSQSGIDLECNTLGTLFKTLKQNTDPEDLSPEFINYALGIKTDELQGQFPSKSVTYQFYDGTRSVIPIRQVSTYYLNCSGKDYINGTSIDQRLFDKAKLLFLNYDQLTVQKSSAYIKIYNQDIIKMIPDFSNYQVRELIKTADKPAALVSQNLLVKMLTYEPQQQQLPKVIQQPQQQSPQQLFQPQDQKQKTTIQYTNPPVQSVLLQQPQNMQYYNYALPFDKQQKQFYPPQQPIQFNYSLLQQPYQFYPQQQLNFQQNQQQQMNFSNQQVQNTLQATQGVKKQASQMDKQKKVYNINLQAKEFQLDTDNFCPILQQQENPPIQQLQQQPENDNKSISNSYSSSSVRDIRGQTEYQIYNAYKARVKAWVMDLSPKDIKSQLIQQIFSIQKNNFHDSSVKFMTYIIPTDQDRLAVMAKIKGSTQSVFITDPQYFQKLSKKKKQQVILGKDQLSPDTKSIDSQLQKEENKEELIIQNNQLSITNGAQSSTMGDQQVQNKVDMLVEQLQTQQIIQTQKEEYVFISKEKQPSEQPITILQDPLLQGIKLSKEYKVQSGVENNVIIPQIKPLSENHNENILAKPEGTTYIKSKDMIIEEEKQIPQEQQVNEIQPATQPTQQNENNLIVKTHDHQMNKNNIQLGKSQKQLNIQDHQKSLLIQRQQAPALIQTNQQYDNTKLYLSKQCPYISEQEVFNQVQERQLQARPPRQVNASNVSSTRERRQYMESNSQTNNCPSSFTQIQAISLSQSSNQDGYQNPGYDDDDEVEPDCIQRYPQYAPNRITFQVASQTQFDGKSFIMDNKKILNVSIFRGIPLSLRQEILQQTFPDYAQVQMRDQSIKSDPKAVYSYMFHYFIQIAYITGIRDFSGFNEAFFHNMYVVNQDDSMVSLYPYNPDSYIMPDGITLLHNLEPRLWVVGARVCFYYQHYDLGPDYKSLQILQGTQHHRLQIDPFSQPEQFYREYGMHIDTRFLYRTRFITFCYGRVTQELQQNSIQETRGQDLYGIVLAQMLPFEFQNKEVNVSQVIAWSLNEARLEANLSNKERITQLICLIQRQNKILALKTKVETLLLQDEKSEEIYKQIKFQLADNTKYLTVNQIWNMVWIQPAYLKISRLLTIVSWIIRNSKTLIVTLSLLHVPIVIIKTYLLRWITNYALNTSPLEVLTQVLNLSGSEFWKKITGLKVNPGFDYKIYFLEKIFDFLTSNWSDCRYYIAGILAVLICAWSYLRYKYGYMQDVQVQVMGQNIDRPAVQGFSSCQKLNPPFIDKCNYRKERGYQLRKPHQGIIREYYNRDPIIQASDAMQSLQIYEKTGSNMPLVSFNTKLRQDALPPCPKYMATGKVDTYGKMTSLPQVVIDQEASGLQALCYRQCAVYVKPDPDILAEFKDYCLNIALPKIYSRVPNDIYTLRQIIKFQTVDEYIQSVEVPKRKRYSNQYQTFLRTGVIPNYYSVMVKHYEIFNKSLNNERADEQLQASQKPRKRIVMCPKHIVTLGYLNANFIQIAKAAIGQSFVHAADADELLLYLQDAYKKMIDPVCYSFDHSSHDSHQHIDLLKIVDDNFINHYIDNLLNISDIPKCYHPEVKKAATRHRFKARGFYKSRLLKKQVTLFKTTILGTVFSGETLGTTMGNTIRVYLYNEFVKHKAHIRDQEILKVQAGDDVFGVVERSQWSNLVDTYRKIYYTEKTRMIKQYKLYNPIFYKEQIYYQHGLGLQMKSLHCTQHSIDFLSKIGYLSRNVSFMHRKFTNAIVQSNVTEKVNFLSKDEHFQAVTYSLLNGCRKVPIIKDYVEQRIANMPQQFSDRTKAYILQKEKWAIQMHNLNPYQEYYAQLYLNAQGKSLLQYMPSDYYYQTLEQVMYVDETIFTPVFGMIKESHSLVRRDSKGNLPLSRNLQNDSQVINLSNNEIIKMAEFKKEEEDSKAYKILKAAKDKRRSVQQNRTQTRYQKEILKTLNMLKEAMSQTQSIAKIQQQGQNPQQLAVEYVAEKGQGPISTAMNDLKQLNPLYRKSAKLLDIGYEDRKEADDLWKKSLIEYDMQKIANKEQTTQDEAYNKYLTRQAYSQFCQTNGLSQQQFSRNDYLRIIALDDWQSWVSTVGKLATEYGPTIWNFLSKWLSNRSSPDRKSFKTHVQEILAGDSLLPAKQVPLQNLPVSYGPSVGVTLSGLNTGIQQLAVTQQQYNYRSVNNGYIASVICPSLYQDRRPSQGPEKTALSYGAWSQTLSTNASGNLGFYLWTQQICGTNAAWNNVSSVTTSYCVLYNQATFNPVDGTDGANHAGNVFFAGPLQATSGSIQNYRIVSTAYTLTPLLPLNQSSGQMQMVYCQNPPSLAFRDSSVWPALPQGQLPSMPFYTQGNMLSQLRMIHIPDSDQDQFYDPVNQQQPPFTDFCYGLITGAPPNTTAVKLEVSYVVQFYPTWGSMPICYMKPATPGAASDSFIASLLTQQPGIQSISESEARLLATQIYNGPVDHDQLLQSVRQTIQGISMRPQAISLGSYSLPVQQAQLQQNQPIQLQQQSESTSEPTQ